MARKRTALTPEQDARIEAGIRRGETADQVAAALGGVLSSRTIGRRMREIRGPVTSRATQRGPEGAPPTSRPTSTTSLPSAPEDIPDDASLTQLDGWIEMAEEAIELARNGGNLPLLGQLLRVVTALAETRRKATPPAKPDPNDSPDMIKLGAEVAARLHEMIDIVARGAA